MLEVYDAATMEHWPEAQLRFSGSLCFTVCVLLAGASFGAFWFALGLSFTSYEKDLRKRALLILGGVTFTEIISLLFLWTLHYFPRK